MQYVDYVLGKVRGKLYAINRVKQVYPAIMHLVYQVYILPILDYCDVVWLPSNSNATCRLERIHSKFTSFSPSSDTFNLRLSLTERRNITKASPYIVL